MCDFTFSLRIRFRTQFWTFPGSLLGAFWPPRWLKPVLEFLLERPRAVQDYFFWLQERPKRLPRASHKRLEASPWPTKPFSGLQEASKSPRGRQAPFGSHVGTILESFRSNFEAMLPPCWSRFLAEGSFTKGPRSNVPGPAECARAIRRPPPVVQGVLPEPGDYSGLSRLK